MKKLEMRYSHVYLEQVYQNKWKVNDRRQERKPSRIWDRCCSLGMLRLFNCTGKRCGSTLVCRWDYRCGNKTGIWSCKGSFPKTDTRMSNDRRWKNWWQLIRKLMQLLLKRKRLSTCRNCGKHNKSLKKLKEFHNRLCRDDWSESIRILTSIASLRTTPGKWSLHCRKH